MTTKKAKNKETKQQVKQARRDARQEKKEVRAETKETKKEARQDKRDTRKDARQEAKQTKKEARQDAKAVKTAAKGGTKEEKKTARQDAGSTRKEGRQDAKAIKTTTRRETRTETRDEIRTAKDVKREAVGDIRDEMKEEIAAARTGWVNWLDDLQTDADRVESPTTTTELRRIVEAAVADDVRLKPIGSGHSHSNAAQPSEGHRFVDLSLLTGLADTTIERRGWRHRPGHDGADETEWVRVRSGTRIQEMTTQLLPPLGLGLLNVGTFDGQTISGAVNTGTHGTGFGQGTFGDMVRSADMFVVVPDQALRPRVEHWRLEPADGPTDPATAEDLDDIDRLVQDDDLFYAMIVGYGSFGIASSYLLAVRPYYWLKESAKPTTVAGLADVLNGDSPDSERFLNTRHPWAFVNVAWAQVDDRRNDEPQELADIPVRLLFQEELDDAEMRIPDDFKHKIHPLWPPMRKRDGLFEGLVTRAAPRLSDSGTEPGRFVANSVDRAFIEDDEPAFFHTGDRSAYYRVIRRIRDNSLKRAKSPTSRLDNTRLDGPPGVLTRGLSFDLSVPVEQVDVALNRLLAECEEETIRLNIPLGIRFTAASKHMMAASYGRQSAFLELVGTVDNKRQHERDLQRYKRVLWNIEKAIIGDVETARPHLGKHHELDHDALIRLFPKAKTWLELQGLFNFAGTWTSPFTETFDAKRYRRSARETRAWLVQRLP